MLRLDILSRQYFYGSIMNSVGKTAIGPHPLTPFLEERGLGGEAQLQFTHTIRYSFPFHSAQKVTLSALASWGV